MVYSLAGRLSRTAVVGATIFHTDGGRVARGWARGRRRPPLMAPPETFGVRELSITDDGCHACVTSTSTYTWNLIDGTCALFDGPADRARDRRDKRTMQVSPDGAYALCADGEVVRVTDLASLREIAILEVGGTVRDIAICDDRAAVSVDGRVSVWRYALGAREFEVDVEPDQIGDPAGWYTHARLVRNRLVVFRWIERVVVYRIGEPRPERVMSSSDARPACFSADASRVLAISRSPYTSRRTIAQWMDVAGARVHATLDARRPVTCAAMMPDEALAVLGHADGTATVWSVGHERLLQTLEQPLPIDAVAITPDASTIVVTPQGADVFVWKRAQ
jgi:hypothetical protein